MPSRQDALLAEKANASNDVVNRRLECVGAVGAQGVECAVSEFTDALLGSGDDDGAVIVAGLAGCGAGACWIAARVLDGVADEPEPQLDDMRLAVGG